MDSVAGVMSMRLDPLDAWVAWLIALVVWFTLLDVCDRGRSGAARGTRRRWYAVAAAIAGTGMWVTQLALISGTMPPGEAVGPPQFAVAGLCLALVPAVCGALPLVWALFTRPRWPAMIASGAALAGGAMLTQIALIGSMQGVVWSIRISELVLVVPAVALQCALATSAYRVIPAAAGEAVRKLGAAFVAGTAIVIALLVAQTAFDVHALRAQADLETLVVPARALAASAWSVGALVLASVVAKTASELRQANVHHHQGRLVNLLPEGLIFAESNGAALSVTSANVAAEHMFSRGDLTHQNIHDLLPEAPIDDVLAGATCFVQIPCADGPLTTETKAFPQFARGRLNYVFVLRDVTREHEQELRLSRLHSALQHAHAAVAILDGDGDVVYRNDSSLTMFERDGSDDALPETLATIAARDDVAARVASREHIVVPQTCLEGTGSEWLAEVTITPVDPDDERCDWLWVFRDVTESVRRDAELRQAQKLEAIGQLSSGIAHEINTPAQYVSDNVTFLKEGWEDLGALFDAVRALTESASHPAVADAWDDADVAYLEDEVPKALVHCRAGLDQIKKIVGAMKKFAHPGGDGTDVANVNELIETTVAIARNEWKYCATVDLELCDDLNTVKCHVSGLNQVLLNMIVNASHAIQDRFPAGDGEVHGVIGIATANTHDGVEVRISDNGCGIQDELRERIFDQFFTTKAVGRGSGQGLAIAHGVIVDQHGGSIDVVSAPGEGTTFVLQLPRTKPEQEQTVRAAG